MSLFGNVLSVLQNFLHGQPLMVELTKRFAWTGVNVPDPKESEAANMQSVVKLFDAICTAWDNAGYAPVYDNGVLQVTYCNFFLHDVAEMMGCHDFKDPTTGIPKTADEIIAYVQGADDWQELRCAGLSDDQMKIALSSIQ